MPNPEESLSQLGLVFPEAPANLRRVWRVGQLVGEVRNHIEREYADVWVEGEISNYRPAPSGHVYFTLKDGDAQLPVVLFRRQAMLLRFRPEDGLQILVRGRVSVYEQRGQMQLVAEFVEPVGAGSLQIAFEQLKARLQKEGLFAADRKQPLPAFPHCIGIITSPTGAVIRDFLNVAGRRHLALHVQLYPSAVQGETAALEIAAGIAFFNQSRTVDVIVVARGGGSLEDLAPFNSELLARAIAKSRVASGLRRRPRNRLHHRRFCRRPACAHPLRRGGTPDRGAAQGGGAPGATAPAPEPGLPLPADARPGALCPALRSRSLCPDAQCPGTPPAAGG